MKKRGVTKMKQKTFICADRDTSTSRLRQSSGKGKISFLKRSTIVFLYKETAGYFCIDGPSSFHKSSIDIFECNEEDNMNSAHFLTWINRTASLLRKEFGKIYLFTISIIILGLRKSCRNFSGD